MGPFQKRLPLVPWLLLQIGLIAVVGRDPSSRASCSPRKEGNRNKGCRMSLLELTLTLEQENAGLSCLDLRRTLQAHKY